MCGIAGTIDVAGRPVSAEVLARACARMRHRGPDDAGTFIHHHATLSVGLAAVRLAIVDPTSASRQPMTVGDGRYVLVFNGEIYNQRALRRELESGGWRFRTSSDTEVLAAWCAAQGPEGLGALNGMFALAFFDTVERCGFIARDRFGIKPLLVARHPRGFCFASEMRALAAFCDWERAVDHDALAHYLAFGYFAAPRSVYRDVTRVMPGDFHRFDAHGLHAGEAYSIPACTAPDLSDQAAVRTRLRGCIAEAVARRRMADVPLGAFLSGGVDSAIIATHLAEATTAAIPTFAIGFTDAPRYDETRHARRMADHLGSDHHELRLSFADVIATLPDMLDQAGEPFFDSSLIPTACVSRLARDHVKVCLSGDAGDELFGGYWRYLGHAAVDGYRQFPKWLRRGVCEPLLRACGASKRSSWGNRVRQFRKLLRAADETPMLRHLRWSALLDDRSAGVLRAPERFAGVLVEMAERFDRVGDAGDGDFLNRILAFDLRHGLPGDMLHKVDLASMAHSLEVRVPFLDPEVVGLVEACPAAWKIDRGLRKRLLVESYRGIIPDEILDRDKMGFELPIGEFLRGELRALFMDTVTRDRVEALAILDHGAIMDIYATHCAGRGEHADLLFALLALCWWQGRAE
jgi:asparagine synthase (glutamine-hydrolysing)